MTDKTMLVQKTSIRFAKTGPAARHSHHDMIRFWERVVRRADLPVRLTQGFNPRPRMVFPHALGVGVRSRHEEIELEFFAPVAPDEIVRRLSLACAGVLEVISATELPPTRSGRQIQESFYLLGPWPAGIGARLSGAIAALLARSEIQVTRGAPGAERSTDIRRFLELLSYDPDENMVKVTFNHNAAGSARPDEIVKFLAMATGADWHEIEIEKTGMVLK